jgi:hypothetical protein
MSTKAKSILQPREADATRSITLKLPLPLVQELQQFQADLARQAPQLSFNVNAICAEALRQALRQARQELAGRNATSLSAARVSPPNLAVESEDTDTAVATSA